MTKNGPPSPASFAGSDWGSGPRGGPPPHKNGPLSPGSPGGGSGGRANLPTPPVSGSSNGSMMNGGPPPGPPGPGGPYGPMSGPPPPRTDSRGPGGSGGPGGPGGPMGHPSPPQSLGRLSTSSNLSTRDPEAARRRQMMLEDALGHHYATLKTYLASDLKRDPEGRSKRARDKLLRLSPIQFHELSTDIYDELRRRQNQHRAPPNAPNFLVPKENFHPKRNQARQKLSTLPEPRFRDLASDVFFELERRFPRFTGRPPPNGMGPPGRTGTPMGYRGHTPRQDSLASSIMSPDGYGRGPQGNTIIPNKSYLVEDDDDPDMEFYGIGKRDTTATNRSFGGGKVVAEYQSKIEELEGKLESLEVQLKEKDDELEGHKFGGPVSDQISDRNGKLLANIVQDGEDPEELRKSLEEKLSTAQSLNRNLQEEIDNVRIEHARSEEQLREQIEGMNQQSSDAVHLRTQHEELMTDHSELRETHETLQQQHDALQRQLKESSGGGEWRARCEDLEGENENLRRSVQDQQRVTKEVRTEAAGFLAEMRTMIEQNDQSSRREEKLSQRNSQLEAEIQEWKDRYARTKSQLRSTKTASMGLPNQQPTVGQSMRSSGGLISDVDITKFQVSVDDTLKTARSGEAHQVLEKVKDVVAAVRPMVRGAANVSDSRAVKARNKLTATVNNFITAGKNFAQSGGISPVSLLDAAASHLSTAIVELASIVKIRSAEDGEGDQSGPAANRAPAPQKPQIATPANAYQGPGDADDDYDPTAGYYADTPVTSNGAPTANGTPLSPTGELLPSTAYQLPSTTYQPLATPARKPVGGATKPLTNGHGPEPDLIELRHFLDDQTSALIASIQSLVTSIRGAAPAAEVQDRLATFTSTSGAILQRSSDAVASSSNSNLKSQASPLVSALEQSFSRLQAKESEGHSISEGSPEYKKWCQGVPPIGFEIARVVKDLGGKVRMVSEGEDDFS